MRIKPSLALVFGCLSAMSAAAAPAAKDHLVVEGGPILEARLNYTKNLGRLIIGNRQLRLAETATLTLGGDDMAVTALTHTDDGAPEVYLAKCPFEGPFEKAVVFRKAIDKKLADDIAKIWLTETSSASLARAPVLGADGMFYHFYSFRGFQNYGGTVWSPNKSDSPSMSQLTEIALLLEEYASSDAKEEADLLKRLKEGVRWELKLESGDFRPAHKKGAPAPRK